LPALSERRKRKLPGNMPNRSSNMLAVPKSERIPCEIFYVIPSEVEAATQAAAGGEARLSIPVHYLKAALRDPSTPLRSAQDDV
jgi:hypothetical protein